MIRRRWIETLVRRGRGVGGGALLEWSLLLVTFTPFFRAHASMVECVVIGAGLAGLQAARRLKDCGVSGKLTQ